jgi:hypothetical protein
MGTVTVDGIEVFNGDFTTGPDSELDRYLCKFTHPVEDQYGWELEPLPVNLSVTVTITTGAVAVGMLKYNYARKPNPLLSTTELAYLTSDTITIAPIVVKADVEAKGGWRVTCATEFDYGMTPDTTYCNRFDIRINNLALLNENGHSYITVNAGETLSFTTLVFSVPYE